MKTNPKQRTIGSIYHRMKDKINLSDKRFQRGSVWTREQEQFLIDTLIKSLDIPKLYFWDVKNEGVYDYSVVDGQQRLTTIFRFLNNELELMQMLDITYTSARCLLFQVSNKIAPQEQTVFISFFLDFQKKIQFSNF